RVGDVDEVLPKLARDVLVRGVLDRQLESHAEQIQAVHRHPARAVGLPQDPSGRKLHVAVEETDVVEPEEAALEDVVAELVLAVDPPVEVEEQLVEDTYGKFPVALSGHVLLDLVDVN